MIYAVFTTYAPRVANLPAVVKSIQDQTVKPDKIMMIVTDSGLVHYAPEGVECLVVNEDTKTFKKFLPAIELMQPDDLVLTIDDDKLYHPDMLADMLAMHERYPDHAIAGNPVWFRGLKCHCGECSLVQPRFYEGWRQYYHLWRTVPSHDMFVTMLAAKNQHAYIGTQTDWAKVAKPYNEGTAYSVRGMVPRSYDIIAREFGWSK